MKHVRPRIAPTGDEAAIHPMYGVLTSAPCVERATAIQWNPTEEALGILHYVVGDADAFTERLAEIPEGLGYELAMAGEDAFYVYIRDATTETLKQMFGSLTDGGLVIVPPIRYREDGTVVLSLFGPDAELQGAIEAVPDPVDIEIDSVSSLDGTPAAVEARLSERQRAAVATALEVGYYDVPRTGSQADVAAALDCSTSTAAEHLRKAESKLVRSVFGATLPAARR